MSQTKALEVLPAELQRQILLQAETLDDLRCLIRASPRFHQVFLQNKDRILSATARRQFHPAALPDALAFAKLSQLGFPLSRESAIGYCQKSSNELSDCQQNVTTRAETVALCKLAQNVGFFIEDFARNSLPILKGLGQSLDLEILPEYPLEKPAVGSQLSPSEIGRLQRAFCRFEIYRCLFAKCSSKLEHDLYPECPFSPPIDPLDPSEQASLYIERLPDFQIVEIICVRDYLFRRLRGICSQLEAEAVETLSPQTFMFDPKRDVECDEWYSGVHFFCDSFKPHQDAHFEHLISLGLPYIRLLFETTGDQRRILFLRDYPVSDIHHRERKFITSAIACLGKNPAKGDMPYLAETDPPFVYRINRTVELDIPDAWQWAHRRGPPHSLKDSGMKGLRDWGYVFWDRKRLQESGILDKDAEDVRKVEFDGYDAGHGPSVQRQLVPASYFDEPEYSDMEDWDVEESVWGDSEWDDSDWEDIDWEDGETDETAVDDTSPVETDTELTEVGEMEEIKMDDTGAVDLHTEFKEDGKVGEIKMDNTDVNNSQTELTEDAGCRE